MFIEYQIQNNNIVIVSKSELPIASSNIVVSDDIDRFNAFKNRFNTARNTTVIQAPNDTWVKMPISESDQLYNWYLIADFKNIFKRHNERKYSKITYCCSRHKDIVRKNLKRLGYAV